MASEEIIYFLFFLNLDFLLPWQPIKFRGLEKIICLAEALLKEYFCETLVKISTVSKQ